MNKKIKPVLRYAGSKYRKIEKIIDTLKITNKDEFIDVFGGSGIVGVNVKHITNANVSINDFDKVLPIKESTALSNMLTFGGNGKNFTKGAFEYFVRRVENGYWDKLKIYNNEINKCNISHTTFEKIDFTRFGKLYVDPPYDDIKGLYKEDFNKEQHVILRDKLNEIKSDSKILISYNDTPFIRELYKEWNISTEEFQYQSGHPTKDGKKRKVNELWITNF